MDAILRRVDAAIERIEHEAEYQNKNINHDIALGMYYAIDIFKQEVDMKTTRLEVLKREREQIKGMHCLAFRLIDSCLEWYDNEIEAIEKYGSPNEEFEVKGDE